MAVSSSNGTTTEIGNGSTTVFPFAFLAASAEEVAVTVDGLAANPAGYEVALTSLAPSTGTVTFDIAPGVGVRVAIGPRPSFLQEISIEVGGPFSSRTVERGFDRSVLRDQFLDERIDRSIRAAPGEAVAELPITASRAGKFLAFDAEGNPVALAGTGSDANLRTDLAASGGGALVAYLATGAGAARSVQAKLRDTVSVKDFGAIGDGATNDTAAINAAVAAAGGKSVFFPAGRYLYDGGASLANGQMVIGEGRNASIILSRLGSPTSGYLIRANGYGSGVRGLGFQANTTQTAGCYVSLAGTESFIDDFSISGDINGVLMRGVGARIRHGRFTSPMAGAIRIKAEGGDTSQVIDDVLLGGESPANTAAAGIRVRNSAALIISNTSVIQQGIGLLIDPISSTTNSTDGGNVYSLYVNNSLFDNCTKAMSVNPTGGSGLYRARFANSWFGSSTSDGVTLLQTSGAHFDSCHMVLSGASGLTTGAGCSDIRINGGLIAANAQGLYFNNAFAGLSIRNAVIGAGGGLAGNTGSGIVIADAAFTGVLVVGNSITGNGTAVSNAAGMNVRFADNIGFVTQKHGTTSITTDGSGEANIAHGLAGIPSFVSARLVENSANDLCISSVDATNIKVRVRNSTTDAAVTAATKTVMWEARL